MKKQHMKHRPGYDEVDIADLPISPRMVAGRNHLFGLIGELSNDELIDPDELERLVFIQEFAPVLMLPGVSPNKIGSDYLDWDI